MFNFNNKKLLIKFNYLKIKLIIIEIFSIFIYNFYSISIYYNIFIRVLLIKIKKMYLQFKFIIT